MSSANDAKKFFLQGPNLSTCEAQTQPTQVALYVQGVSFTIRERGQQSDEIQQMVCESRSHTISRGSDI